MADASGWLGPTAGAVAPPRATWLVQRALAAMCVVLGGLAVVGAALAAWPTPYHGALEDLSRLPWPALAPARVGAFELDSLSSEPGYELRYRTLGGRASAIRARPAPSTTSALADRANPLRLGRQDVGDDVYETIEPYGQGLARRRVWQAWGVEYTWVELRGDEVSEPLRWGHELAAAADLATLPTERASPFLYALMVLGAAGAALGFGAAAALGRRVATVAGQAPAGDSGTRGSA